MSPFISDFSVTLSATVYSEPFFFFFFFLISRDRDKFFFERQVVPSSRFAAFANHVSTRHFLAGELYPAKILRRSLYGHAL